MKKKTLCCFLSLILLLCVLSAFSGCAEEIDYYFRNACESCSPEEDFRRDFERLTGTEPENLKIRYHNVFQEKGFEEYQKATADLTEEEKGLPLLIMDGQVYHGNDGIAGALTARFGTAPGNTDSVIYFLTSMLCESCSRARETIDRCPAIVPVESGSRFISSRVIIREINVSREPGTALALFRQFQVPDGERKTPMVLMGKTVLSGGKAIEEELMDRLKKGEGMGTPVLSDAVKATEENDFLSLGGAFLAGLTAGFNPCALSMLLTMLGILLNLRRSVLRYGGLYLGGKFAAYLAIGLVFSDLWLRYAPHWLPLAVKILTTAIGMVLVILNLRDAWNAGHEQYGQIRNQLPAGVRKGIRTLIERMIGRAGAHMGIAAVLLGILVAGGEFMCAGQLYLAFLVSASGMNMVLPLLVYCTAFILPSVCLTVLVASTRKTVMTSDWLLRRMPLIKVAAALVLAALLCSLWVPHG